MLTKRFSKSLSLDSVSFEDQHFKRLTFFAQNCGTSRKAYNSYFLALKRGTVLHASPNIILAVMGLK
jgi:hypothetical protein